jgi:hypothetical protein
VRAQNVILCMEKMASMMWRGTSNMFTKLFKQVIRGGKANKPSPWKTNMLQKSHRKWDLKCRFKWLRTGSSGGVLQTRQQILKFHNRQEIYWPAKWLSASLDGLCITELVQYVCVIQWWVECWCWQITGGIFLRKQLQMIQKT